jgi:hypothetical protein
MNSVIKALVAVFSLILLFACGGGGDDVSASAAFTQPTSTEGRMKAQAVTGIGGKLVNAYFKNLPTRSGEIGIAVNDRFDDCMDGPLGKFTFAGKYADCVGKAYVELFSRSQIEDQLFLRDTDGNGRGDTHIWLPAKGRATIGGNFILVQFKFDEAAINFFKTKFVGSDKRLPIGLEIDLSPLNNDVFRKAGSVMLLTSSGDDVSHEAGIFLDTTKYDKHPGYGAVIRNPHKLQVGTPYAVVFHTEGAPWYAPWEGDALVQAAGEVVLTFQVSVDTSLAKPMIAAYDSGDHQLNGFSNDGGGGAFDYFVPESDGFNPMNIPSDTRICWYAKSGDDIGCSGGNPINQPLAETVIANGGAVPQSSVSSGDAILQSGTVAMPLNGPGGTSMVIGTPVPDLPDFITRRAILLDSSGIARYTYLQTETIRVHSITENVGDADWAGNRDDMYVMALLSNGTKEDSHSEWRNVGMQQIQKDNIRVGDEKDEYFNVNLATLNNGIALSPGIYNFAVCSDRKEVNDNGDGEVPEKHKSNNCSTEAVFEVTADPSYIQPQPDLVVHSLTLLQTPTYGGDQIRIGGYIKNNGNIRPPNNTRASYMFSCNGGPAVMLADDGTEPDKLNPGASEWEETLEAVQMPNVSGTCIISMVADYLGQVGESNEGNNTASLSITLLQRPAPNLIITKFQDEIGCCTTNLGKRIRPNIWVRNDGSAAPAATVPVIFHIASPVATGGAYIYIGSGTIRPDELPPGGTDEDYMDNSWSIPSSSAWKKQWHTVRGCLKPDGSAPVGGGPGEVCAYYTRYSKE